MTNTKTLAAPRNTEEQLVGRARSPVVGDRYYWWTPVVSTITVDQVEAHNIGCLHDGPDGARAINIPPDDWPRRVRQFLGTGAEFVPANARNEAR